MNDQAEQQRFPAWARGPGWDRWRGFLWRHKVWAVAVGVVIGLVLSQIPRQIAHAETGEPLVDDGNYMATDPAIGTFTMDSRICLPGGSVELGCLWSTAKEVTKARAGYFTKKSGFNPDNVFVHPALARNAFADGIAAKIVKGNRDNIYAKYDPVPHVCNTDQCLAYKMYDAIANDASCASRGVPTNEAGTCARTPQSSITQQGVINGISLAVCGAGVAIAVVTGGKGAALVAGGMGGACVWDAWKTWVFGN